MSTKLTDITKQLTSFLASDATSILLKETNGISGISLIEAHIQKRRLEADRSGKIVLTESTDNRTNCLNIVHVAVAERSRRKGLFSDFLELLEGFDYSNYLDASSDWSVRIDKVMNPVLDECLPKKGYARIRSGDEAHFSYLKIIRRRTEVGRGRSYETNNDVDLAAIPLFLMQEETCHDR